MLLDFLVLRESQFSKLELLLFDYFLKGSQELETENVFVVLLEFQFELLFKFGLSGDVPPLLEAVSFDSLLLSLFQNQTVILCLVLDFQDVLD